MGIKGLKEKKKKKSSLKKNLSTPFIEISALKDSLGIQNLVYRSAT